MSFSEIVVVSKLSGLYQMHKHRADGLILKSLQDDKIFFAASRAHTFTPLDNITIYTSEDPVELQDVMLMIKNRASNIQLPSPKEDGANLKKFFTSILPNYDDSRVYTSDIQKIIKWFTLLDSKNMILNKDEARSKESDENAIQNESVAAEEVKEVKPKAKSTRKKKTEE